jgi:hypothetical protein
MTRTEYLQWQANSLLWVRLLRQANEWRRHRAWCRLCPRPNAHDVQP